MILLFFFCLRERMYLSGILLSKKKKRKSLQTAQFRRPYSVMFYTVSSASVAVKMLSFLCLCLNPETGFLNMIHKSTLSLLRGSYSAVIHSRIYVSSCYSGFQALERMLIECSKHVESLELKSSKVQGHTF